MKIREEEEHAKIVLEGELGIEFHHHDDGSKDGMPDLLSFGRKARGGSDYDRSSCRP